MTWKENPLLKTTRWISLLIGTSLLLAGCQAPSPSALSNDQVAQAADHVLKAVNRGDYPAFSQDFSEAMKTAFAGSQFTSLQATLHNASGDYESCAPPELSNSQGYALYRLDCTFTREHVMVTVTYQIKGDKIEGLFLDSTNLRKTGQ